MTSDFVRIFLGQDQKAGSMFIRGIIVDLKKEEHQKSWPMFVRRKRSEKVGEDGAPGQCF